MAGGMTTRAGTTRTARAAASAAVWAAVCGVALTGCASPGGGATAHNDVSRCAAVLPTARDLMHGQGRLVLVRPVKLTDVDTIARDAGQPAAPAPTPASAPPAAPASGATAAPARPSPHPQAAHPQGAHPPGARPLGVHQQGGHPGTPGRTPRLCLVAYQGDFSAATIAGVQPASATGQFALIFVWVRHPRVQRILLTNSLPASAHRSWWHF